MKTFRNVAIAVTLVAGALTGAMVGANVASATRCPKQKQPPAQLTAKAQMITKDYRTIEEAARAVGVTMTSDRQVVAVMVFPTFVDTRVVASDNGCQIIGVLANNLRAASVANDRSAFVWTPPLPTAMASGFGERFVTSSPGSITVELRANAQETWRRYVATSASMRWTSGK